MAGGRGVGKNRVREKRLGCLGVGVGRGLAAKHEG